MATSKLTNDALDFTSNGSSSNAKLTATSDSLLTLSSNAGNGVRLTGLTTGSADSDAATKQYVDDVAQGLDVKPAVRVATTASANLNTAYADGQTVDGIELVSGNRILIKNQTTASENGIYVVEDSGAPVRASDFATGSSAAGAFCFVEEGTANADRGFVCVSDATAADVGTDSLAFTQFSGAGQIAAGTNLTKSGDTISVAAAPTFAGAITAASGSAIGNLSLANGSITDSSGAISFGDENLSTTGTLGCGVLTAATGSAVGNLSLANGSITDSSGAISFGNENLSTTGTLGCGVLTAATGSAVGNLSLANGSITDSSGAISFGNENLSTTGTLGCGVLTAATGSAVGNLSLANGSITDSSGAISFGNENLSTTGTLSAASVTSTSDERLKTDVVGLTASEAATFVHNLRPVRFEWKDADMRAAHGSEIGFLAQEVEALLPEIVVTDAEGVKSIDYAKLTAVLVAALQLVLPH